MPPRGALRHREFARLALDPGLRRYAPAAGRRAWSDATDQPLVPCGPQITGCYEDYVALAYELSPTMDLETCHLGLREELLIGTEAEVDEAKVSPEWLQQDLIAELGMPVFLDSMAERPLGVAIANEWQLQSGVFEQLLQLTDPLVGTFQVRLLWPPGPDDVRVPAIIALPGHPEFADAAVEFLDRNYGRTLAESGYLVAVNSFRAYDSHEAESRATYAMLCAGSSMQAVRHYETLLVDRVVRWLRAEGRVGRIGVVAHSGGSVTGNALVRYRFEFEAFVSDLQSIYLAWADNAELDGSGGLWFIDDTHPGLHMIHLQINRGALVRRIVPVLHQPYGFTDGPEPLLEFLDSHLR